MRAVMPLVNFLCTLSTLAFVFLGLCTFDACRFECVILAGVARPSFLTVPWAILRDVEIKSGDVARRRLERES